MLLAIANVAFYAAGVEVEGQPPALSGVLAFAGIMLVAAWGLWTQRYWAVLGFQALLAITIVVAALSLLVASNIAAVVLCLVIVGAGGWLFWKLVRVLGRMKVPRLGDVGLGVRRSIDSNPWPPQRTTASSSAPVPADMSPRSAPPSSA